MSGPDNRVGGGKKGLSCFTRWWWWFYFGRFQQVGSGKKGEKRERKRGEDGGMGI